jgi:diaminohydroxyphosphoribosylaminopyrimidine deaminase / 5-amino-6-(5-phosphoribosylamino)uracil reductase
MDTKKIKMLRCIELAQNALGNTCTNPLVGALLAIDNTIIGEGYHQYFGGAHAEVNAINAVKNHDLLKLSTLFVNLEPCSHFGKTPPCADLIIDKQIPRVVVGMTDPYLKVAGRGIEKLIKAGIDVEIGVLEHECKELNKRFITFHQKNRPFIILKWAETSDGFIDIIRTNESSRKPNWITDESARVLVHKWRTEEQAIVIGTNTALFDNPKLTARDWYGRNPIRMVIDKKLRLPRELSIFDQSIETIVFSETEPRNDDTIYFEKASFGAEFPYWLGEYCYSNSIASIIVEGGTKLLQCFIDSGIWDEARVFKGNISFGEGITAPKLNQTPVKSTILNNSVLNYYYKEK